MASDPVNGDAMQRCYQRFDEMKATGNLEPFYSQEADNYEALVTQEGLMYRFPILSKILSEYYPDRKERAGIKILDLAAGTGLVGKYIHPEGFTNIDGLDGSAEMLEVLKQKGIYTKAIHAFVGGTVEPMVGVPDGTYDVIVMAGGMASGHIDLQGFRQIARALKKGGLFLNVFSEKYTKIPRYEGLEAYLWKMEEDKIWKYILRLLLESPVDGKDCVFQAFRKL